MAIQLDKKEEVDGSVWFFVRDGSGTALNCFRKEEDARVLYNKCVKREKEGYPKFTVIANSSIDTHEISEVKL